MRAVAAQSVTFQWQQRKSRRLPPAHFLGKRWTHGLFRFMRKTCWARCTAAACCLAPVALQPCSLSLFSPPASAPALGPLPRPCPALPCPSSPPPCYSCPAPALASCPLLAQTPFPGRPFLPSWATSCLSCIFLSSPAMDFLEDSDASANSYEDDRLRHRVGHQVLLPRFTGRSLGDDVSWKGSGTTRIATIQCASSGMDRHQWGIWFGEGLASLGADIGILSETGLHTESHHTLACKGLLTRGYQAVSHGRPSRATARVGCSSPSARATPASGPTSAGTLTAEDSRCLTTRCSCLRSCRGF